MIKRAILIGCIVVLALTAWNFDGTTAQSKSSEEGSMQVGVISMKKIFDESKANEKFKQEMTAEQEKAIAELEKGRAEIEAERAGLKTMKSGSAEHMAQMKILMEKQATLTAQQEFVKQQIAFKERQWIENTYKEIVRVANEIGAERGLHLVLENSAIDLTDVPDDMLVMSILMRSVIRDDGCVDITDEVMARLDSMN